MYSGYKYVKEFNLKFKCKSKSLIFILSLGMSFVLGGAGQRLRRCAATVI